MNLKYYRVQSSYGSSEKLAIRSISEWLRSYESLFPYKNVHVTELNFSKKTVSYMG